MDNTNITDFQETTQLGEQTTVVQDDDNRSMCTMATPMVSNESVLKGHKICHDDITARILLRLFSAPIVEDPSSKPKSKKKMPTSITVVDTFAVSDVMEVCQQVAKLFMSQESLVEVPIQKLCYVVADLHGNLTQLLRIFRTCGAPPKSQYVFLGDYVDRGCQGLEVMMLLFCLRIRYPDDIVLLRGNHEDVASTLNYGFFDECIFKQYANSFKDDYHKTTGKQIYMAFLHAFNCMPVAALIGGKVFCCHGGLSPFMDTIQDIKKLARPAVIPPYGLACDLAWSDPSKNPSCSQWTMSHRGISFNYGKKQVSEFCNKNGVEMIIRGHQIDSDMYQTGFKFFCPRLVTVFSAPNYQNFRNNSCVVKIRPNLKLQFVIYRVRQPLTRVQPSSSPSNSLIASVKSSSSSGTDVSISSQQKEQKPRKSKKKKKRKNKKKIPLLSDDVSVKMEDSEGDTGVNHVHEQFLLRSFFGNAKDKDIEEKTRSHYMKCNALETLEKKPKDDKKRTKKSFYKGPL